MEALKFLTKVLGHFQQSIHQADCTGIRSHQSSVHPEGCLMKKIRYGVAMSLDGYVAGPNGEADWIVVEPEFDFGALWAQFDTALMGRRTYQAAMARLGEASLQGMKVVVVSRTLAQPAYPNVTVVRELNRDCIQRLRAERKKDIWLFGGGELFRALLELGEVDTVEVSVIPVLLGGGVAMLPPPAGRTKLKLLEHQTYPTGRVSLVYGVNY
jgi:dihydrofolate reductase